MLYLELLRMTQIFGHHFVALAITEVSVKKQFLILFACLHHAFVRKDFLLLLKVNRKREPQAR